MNYNRIILGGHLTRDPESRSTSTDKQVVGFGLAVNSKWGQKETVLFIDCSAWEKTGAIALEYLRKGDPVLIEGRLDLRTWETKEGDKRSKHSVTVDRLVLLGGKKESASEAGPPSGGAGKAELPF